VFYLYVKKHNITGLKYLGYTKQDVFKYKGSGKYWSRHLKKHGNNVTTEILLETDNLKEIEEFGICYSKLWNIIESEEWANLKEEGAQGGSWPGLYGSTNGMFGKTHTKEARTKISKLNTGNKNPKLSNMNLKRKWWTNGTIDCFRLICPPGYYKGRSKMKGDKNCVNTRWST
jgi:hypothetical protein